MRIPHVYFLKYLVLQKENVADVCTKYGLPVPKGKELPKLKLPEKFSLDPEDRDSMDFLRTEGIYNLVFPDVATKEAFKILELVQARDAIEKLIIAREDPAKIAKTVNTKYKTKFSAETIERYKHYFWNPELMKIEDWAELYSDYNDKRLVKDIAMNGPDYARHVIGFVQGIQIKESLKELAATLHFDMQSLKLTPAGKDKTVSLTNIANALIKIDEKINSSDESIRKEFENFERIRIEHADTNIKGILDVAKVGNYQGSGIELQEIFQKGKVIDYEEV